MDQRHAEVVHYLFLNNYIDNGDDYEFRDEWLVDNYIEAYGDAFEEGNLRPINRYVVKVLKEWYRDSYSKYLDAVDDLMAWVQYDLRFFEPSMGKEIETAYKAGIKAGDGDGFYKPLMQIPSKIVEQVKSKDYEDAVSNIYCIFEQLAKVYQAHANYLNLHHTKAMQTMALYLTSNVSEKPSHLYIVTFANCLTFQKICVTRWTSIFPSST